MVLGVGKFRSFDDRASPAAGKAPTPPRNGKNTNDDGDDLTLANWSKSPRRLPPSTTHKRNKVVQNQHRLMNVQRKHLDSSPNHQGLSDQAQKLASSSKVATDRTLSAGEARSSAVFQAEVIQSKLDPRFPNFVKSLVRSHVGGVFWLGLPAFFCKRYLPNIDTTITLEDESGKEYQLKYIACKTGLSAGWRQFSAVHKLQDGDVLVFQLVEPSKFKVYIVRANGLSELDGAVSLQNLDDYAKQNARDNANKDSLPSNSPKRKQEKPESPPPVIQKKKKKSVPKISPKVRQCAAEQCEYESDETGSAVLDQSLGTELEFKDVKGFENFRIIIDGVPIDSELPHEVRNKYYKLCHSQQAFLHENLIKGINYNLIIGIISEVVKIADALRSRSLLISTAEFAKWDKELLAFEYLGMNMEFLRHRLCRLLNLSYETQDACNTKDASETSRYSTSATEFSQADNGITNIETKLEELKEACDGFGAYIHTLKYKAERFHH